MSSAADTPEEFTWNDGYLLGLQPDGRYPSGNRQVVHAMDVASDAGLSAALERFIAHAEAHFEQEKAWMSLDGFPARDCHVDEHDQVLSSVYQVRGLLAEGDVAVVRSFIVALKDWFPGHADYLAVALANGW